MRVLKESFNVNESSLSRVWQKTHDKDSFAIIGSRDKDTHEDHSAELLNMIKDVSKKYRIGWTPLEGTYTYDNGDLDTEQSYLIDNIKYEDAMRIMRKINQESIIWKDNDYFGFITADGSKDGDLSTDTKNMNFSSDAIKQFGSRLVRGNKNNVVPFIFEMYSIKPNDSKSSVRHFGGVSCNKTKIFEMKCKWE